MSLLSISSPISRSSSISISNSISNSRVPCSLTSVPWQMKKNAFVKLQHRGGGGRKGKGVVVMSMEAGIGVMATKLGMMSYFEPEGEVVPVTVVGFREGNIITQIKTEATDGYNAVQVGYRRVRDRKLTKPEMGHLQKAGAIPMRYLQEFRLQSVDGFAPNQRLIFDEIFNEGDLVDVSGITIGKGFQGFLSFPLFSTSSMSLPLVIAILFFFHSSFPV